MLWINAKAKKCIEKKQKKDRNNEILYYYALKYR